MLEELPLCKVLSSTSQWLSIGLRSGLCGGLSMCVKVVLCSLNHSFTIRACWIVALSSCKMPVGLGKKKSIDGETWSSSTFFWAHNIAEPRADQLKQPQIKTLLTSLHQPLLLTLMAPSLNLDSSDHITFFHCSRVQSFSPIFFYWEVVLLRLHHCLVPTPWVVHK